jgi:2-polyprenyl-3-methyl-5-hydroxy-6-metoxy-1,4-benzoquinol methylase
MDTNIRIRSCPSCNSADHSQLIFKQNIDKSKLNAYSYASRKIPEFMNFNLVCCPSCDLLYVSEVFDLDANLDQAYNTAEYDSNEEAIYAAKTYAQALATKLSKLNICGAALEIGAGNGAFLAELLNLKFQKVIGVEPSISAANCASAEIKKIIRVEMFDAKNFEPESFDLVVICQTLEHLDDPLSFIESAHKLLKYGGMLMVVGHNYRHWLMRLLGARSPIIDIEHFQLFSPQSLEFILNKCNFSNIEIAPLKNGYPLHYWSKLLPIPLGLKKACLKFMKNNSLGRSVASRVIHASVGNMVAFARKI